MTTAPSVAVVIPVYNEEPVLPELFQRLAAVFDREPGWAWSVVLVNDGSRDRSATLIAEQHARDPRFKLVDLSRNFGFWSVFSAGLVMAGLSIVPLIATRRAGSSNS
jgi:dolichol-phosphate mannosyltransferase